MIISSEKSNTGKYFDLVKLRLASPKAYSAPAAGSYERSKKRQKKKKRERKERRKENVSGVLFNDDGDDKTPC